MVRAKLTLPLIVVLLRRRMYKRKKKIKIKYQTKPLVRCKRIWLTLLLELLSESKPPYISTLVFLLEIYFEMSSQVWTRQHDKDGKNNLFSPDNIGFLGEEHIEVFICCKHIFIWSGLCWLNILICLHWEFEISCSCLKHLFMCCSLTFLKL